MSNPSIYKNRVISGRPFTLEIDVERWDPDLECMVALSLVGATSPILRLIPPADGGTQSDNSATLPGTPTNRMTFAATGSEVDSVGQWEVRAIYTLSGLTYETFSGVFQVEAAS